MTREELKRNMSALTRLAESLSEPEKTFKLTEIDLLTIQLQGMALHDLHDNLKKVKLIDIEQIDHVIRRAQYAHQNQDFALKTFNYSA